MHSITWNCILQHYMELYFTGRAEIQHNKCCALRSLRDSKIVRLKRVEKSWMYVNVHQVCGPRGWSASEKIWFLIRQSGLRHGGEMISKPYSERPSVAVIFLQCCMYAVIFLRCCMDGEHTGSLIGSQRFVILLLYKKHLLCFCPKLQLTP